MRKSGVVKYKVKGVIKEFAYTYGHNGFGGSDWDGEYYEFVNAKTNVKLKISPKKLAPGEKARLDDEWHKAPYRKKIADLKEISLTEWHDYGDGYWTGKPDGTENIWIINRIPEREAVIFELTDGAVLNIMNNPVREIRGTTFKEALKKLFPKRKITMYVPTVNRVEVA